MQPWARLGFREPRTDTGPLLKGRPWGFLSHAEQAGVWVHCGLGLTRPQAGGLASFLFSPAVLGLSLNFFELPFVPL